MNFIQKTLDKHIKSGGDLLYKSEKEYEILVKYVKSKNGEELIEEISKRIELNEYSGIDVIYEMFYDIKNVERFGVFFIKEFQRGFQTAKTKNNPDSILSSLLALGPVDFKDPGIRHQLLRIFFENVSSNREEIVHYSINFLNRWFEEKDYSKFESELRKIKENLNQSNWKIRFIAFQFLKKFEDKLENISIGLVDKIRGKIGKPYSIK